MKKFIYSLPEVFFICFSAYWLWENFTASGTVNYFATAVMLVMVLLLIFKKRIIGLVSGIALAMFSVFMMLAVRSEFNEFPSASPEGLKLLLTGVGLFFLSVLFAGFMIYKYAAVKPNPDLPYQIF